MTLMRKCFGVWYLFSDVGINAHKNSRPTWQYYAKFEFSFSGAAEDSGLVVSVTLCGCFPACLLSRLLDPWLWRHQGATKRAQRHHLTSTRTWIVVSMPSRSFTGVFLTQSIMRTEPSRHFTGLRCRRPWIRDPQVSCHLWLQIKSSQNAELPDESLEEKWKSRFSHMRWSLLSLIPAPCG
jgi:hypothetical protein